MYCLNYKILRTEIWNNIVLNSEIFLKSWNMGPHLSDFCSLPNPQLTATSYVAHEQWIANGIRSYNLNSMMGNFHWLYSLHMRWVITVNQPENRKLRGAWSVFLSWVSYSFIVWKCWWVCQAVIIKLCVAINRATIHCLRVQLVVRV